MLGLALPLVFIAGALSWHFVGAPALALKRRLTRPQPTIASGAAG